MRPPTGGRRRMRTLRTRTNRLHRERTGGGDDCPPESGGQRDREAHPARGGSQTPTFRLWNHPASPSAQRPLLTQEGNSRSDTSNCFSLYKRLEIQLQPKLNHPWIPCRNDRTKGCISLHNV